MDVARPGISTKRILGLISNKNQEFWHREQVRNSLSLFHRAANDVPAYKDFLKKHKIRPEKIKSYSDLTLIPPTNKRNYLRAYPLEKLAWGGSLKKPLVFTSTSGSTGEPFYFARDYRVDWQASVIHELFLRQSEKSIQGPTLVLVCFGMGVWIGGLITYQAFEMMREAGYPISVLTPGINKNEIFNALRKIGSHFSEIILIGYAPFLKDVIDEAPQNGVNLKNTHLRFIFAAEAFTEKFREYVVKKTSVRNSLLDTMNIYGSADIGAMAFETPTSVLMRQLAMAKPRVFADVFHQIQRTPTLAQYIPQFTSFEEYGGELYLTGDNAIPLVRYAIGDHGGVFMFDELAKKLKDHGIDFEKEARIKGIKDFVYQLPLVYVYERVDMATTLYGLQIYPETIREVLIESPMNKYLTGKLTLITKFDKKHDQYLEINLELRKRRSMTKKIEKMLLNQIIANLRLKNSEFRELSNFLKERVNPKLVFWHAEHPLYFKPGIKQKWVKK